MHNLICTEVQELADPKMSLPWHLSVAVSPGRVQLLHGLAVWTWDFTSECAAWVVTPRLELCDLSPQGFQCIVEHQLCWDSSVLLWCKGLPAFYILRVTLLPGQSRKISREFGPCLPSCQKSIQLACSVAQLLFISAWKIPWAHSSMRSQCKDLVWFILKRPFENLLNQPASGWNETPNT